DIFANGYDYCVRSFLINTGSGNDSVYFSSEGAVAGASAQLDSLASIRNSNVSFQIIDPAGNDSIYFDFGPIACSSLVTVWAKMQSGNDTATFNFYEGVYDQSFVRLEIDMGTGNDTATFYKDGDTVLSQ